MLRIIVANNRYIVGYSNIEFLQYQHNRKCLLIIEADYGSRKIIAVSILEIFEGFVETFFKMRSHRDNHVILED